MKSRVKKILGCVAALGMMAGSASATIVQAEAESGTFAADGWTVEANAGASGGSVISNTGHNQNKDATFSVDFTTAGAGTYDLYVRVVTADNGSKDSFFVGDDFGTNPSSIQENNWLSANSTLSGLPIVDGGVWQDYTTAGDILWINFSAHLREAVPGADSKNEEVPEYVVASAGVLDFVFRTRENDMSIDAFAFVTTGSTNIGVDQNGFLTAVPEPASFAMLCVAAICQLGRRRSH